MSNTLNSNTIQLLLAIQLNKGKQLNSWWPALCSPSMKALTNISLTKFFSDRTSQLSTPFIYKERILYITYTIHTVFLYIDTKLFCVLLLLSLCNTESSHELVYWMPTKDRTVSYMLSINCIREYILKYNSCINSNK